MLIYLSNSIVSFFVKENIISKDDDEVFEYGLELLLSAVISSIIILIIALIFNRVIELILFMFSFILLRQAAGGYHAKTHFRCLIALLSVHFLFFLFLTLLPSSLYLTFLYLFILISVVSIFIFAPVDNENKEFCENDKVKFRKRSLILISLLSITALIIGFIVNNNYGLSFSVGILTASISVTLAKLQQQYDKSRVMRFYNK